MSQWGRGISRSEKGQEDPRPRIAIRLSQLSLNKHTRARYDRRRNSRGGSGTEKVLAHARLSLRTPSNSRRSKYCARLCKQAGLGHTKVRARDNSAHIPETDQRGLHEWSEERC